MFAHMKPKDPEKIARIEQAALSLVRQNGLVGLQMAAIGKATGLGMGTIYGYFESKEVLINSLFQRIKQSHIARIYADQSADQPFRLQFKRLVLNYVRNRLDYFEEHFFIEQCVNSPFLDETSRQLDAGAYTGAWELIERGKRELLLKNLDNWLILAQLMGALNGAIEAWMRQPNPPPLADWLDALVDMVWDSIKQ